MTAEEPGLPVDLDRTRALVGTVDGIIVGTGDPIGTPASEELVDVLGSFPVPTIQVIAAPVAEATPAADVVGSPLEASSVESSPPVETSGV